MVAVDGLLQPGPSFLVVLGLKMMHGLVGRFVDPHAPKQTAPCLAECFVVDQLTHLKIIDSESRTGQDGLKRGGVKSSEIFAECNKPHPAWNVQLTGEKKERVWEMNFPDPLFFSLNRTHFGMRSFSQGCVQDAGVVSKKRKRPPPRRRAAHFSRKGAAKGKGKTLGDESPRPSLFFTK
ncbi:MAG: hypothetical protein H7834_06585 [Magnetococcus sp. YQC-9]